MKALANESKSSCENTKPLYGKFALIVDDEELIRKLLARELKKFGCITLEASNAKEAVEVFGKQALDIVVSDVQMPGGDGMELLLKIAPESKSRGIAILMMSGSCECTDAQIKSYGGLGLIEKPFVMKALCQRLIQHFSSIKLK